MDLDQIQAQIHVLQGQLNAARGLQAPSPLPHRMIHVQVAGAPSTETLKQVANAFNTAIAEQRDVVVPTNMQITVRMLAIDPSAPIPSLLVKGMIDIEAVASTLYEVLAGYATVHDAQAPILLKVKQWSQLDHSFKEEFAQEVASYLHFGTVPDTWDGSIAPICTALVNAMKRLLPSPDTDNLMVEVAIAQVEDRSGSLVGHWTKWEPRDMREIKEGDVFRMSSDRTAVYRAAGPAFVNYAASTGAAYSLNGALLSDEEFPRHPDWVPEVGGPDNWTPEQGTTAEETYSASLAQTEFEAEQDLGKIKGSHLDPDTIEPANAQDAENLAGFPNGFAKPKKPD